MPKKDKKATFTYVPDNIKKQADDAEKKQKELAKAKGIPVVEDPVEPGDPVEPIEPAPVEPLKPTHPTPGKTGDVADLLIRHAPKSLPAVSLD